MRLALRVLGGLVLLAVGAAGGFYFGYRSGEGVSAMGDFGEVAYYGTFLDIQRRNGDDRGYEEALQGYLDILERRKGKPSVFSSSDTAIALDSALTHGRLALLAQKRGANVESETHLSSAVALCGSLRWKTCSAEQILETVRYLDRRGPFGMGSVVNSDAAQPGVAADAPQSARR